MDQSSKTLADESKSAAVKDGEENGAVDLSTKSQVPEKVNIADTEGEKTEERKNDPSEGFSQSVPQDLSCPTPMDASSVATVTETTLSGENIAPKLDPKPDEGMQVDEEDVSLSENYPSEISTEDITGKDDASKNEAAIPQEVDAVVATSIIPASTDMEKMDENNDKIPVVTSINDNVTTKEEIKPDISISKPIVHDLKVEPTLVKTKSMFSSLFPTTLKSNQNTPSSSEVTKTSSEQPVLLSKTSTTPAVDESDAMSKVSLPLPAGNLEAGSGNDVTMELPDPTSSGISEKTDVTEPTSASAIVDRVMTPVAVSESMDTSILEVTAPASESSIALQSVTDSCQSENIKMETTGSIEISSKPITTDLIEKSPLCVSKPSAPEITIKTEMKHPAPASKTMKRDQRKSSTTSPTPSGEKKSGQRSKTSSSPSGKSKKKRPPPNEDGQDGRNDFYCWVCHREGEVLCCELCPRVFHAKCLNMVQEPEGDWFCPECEKITEAECKETQSRAMSMLSIDEFSLLLKYVIQRMKLPGTEPFHDPVDTKMFPDYVDYVFHPMDLSTIEKSVKKRKYGCPEAFVIDFKWIIHNCVIYNGMHSKLTQIAKSMLKIAERELNEIEVCPECYLNSCRKRENWFCEPCKELHPLVWAKLQGFPHWPAKALRIEKGLVDVRFFGQHDRAWIPLSGCYLISKELPLPVKNKKKSKGPALRGGLDGAMQEMQVYIENIKKITGDFEYAPPRTLLTHCDLYRKTASLGKNKTQETSKQKEIRSEGKESSTPGTKSENTDNKAKLELKDISMAKELSKSSALTTSGLKKGKLVTTRGEHPARSFATKKKRASMEFLNKTIESCKASLGIEKLQDVKMNSGSDETSSSSDEDEEENREEKSESKGKEPAATPETKEKMEEDDSDAELVIDLGDVEEPADAGVSKQTHAEKHGETSTKTEDLVVKKRRLEENSDKQPTAKPLKSILHNPAKSVDKDERKKMLARALSEKIATGKRKYESEASPSGASPSNKVRKMVDERSRSPTDKSLGKSGHLKDKKKSHHGSKHSEKDSSGKIKTGILKSSADALGQRKEGHVSSEKRLSDPSKKVSSSKHKDVRDGSQKPPIRKQSGQEKPGKLDKIPTEADTRKLFNGGRIPRKNPISNASDEEMGDREQEEIENNQIQEMTLRRKSIEHAPQLVHSANTSKMNGVARQLSVDEQNKSRNGDIAFDSLKKYGDKVIDSVQKIFHEMYTDMRSSFVADNLASNGSDAATATAMHQVAQLRLELERLKWMHEQEIAEVKHNHDLTVAEIRQSLENEKKQLLLDARTQAEAEKTRVIEETKRKQWCAFCGREAIFYCCWNTSYCDYPCQQKHWPQHMNSCTQAGEGNGAPSTGGGDAKSSTPGKMTSSVPSVRPTPMTTPSTSKSTLTISTSAPTISKLSSQTKSTIILPSSLQLGKQSHASVAGKTAIKVAPGQSSDTVLKISVPAGPESAPVQKGSGFAISAIGARLLAARQGVPGSKLTDSTKTTAAKLDITAPVSITAAATSGFTDHVKTTLDSPLSPDSAPSSTSSLVLPSKVSRSDSLTTQASKTTTVKISVSKPVASKPPVTVTVQTSKPKIPSGTSAPPAQSTSSSSKPTSNISTTSKIQSIPATAKKSHHASTLLTFSSPSVVASLITDMDTPLSSSLSSSPGDLSSSFSESPEKKSTDVKVSLPQTGSAFTKVIPEKKLIEESSKFEKSQKSLSFSLKPTASSSDPTSNTFKAIDSKPSTGKVRGDTGGGSEVIKGDTIPKVAPVLVDSYLSKLQQTLAQKSTGEPKEAKDSVSPDDNNTKPASKTELFRPALFAVKEKDSTTPTSSTT